MLLRKPGPMLAVVLAGLFASACSATRPAEPGTCAVVGAAIGGLGGTGIGVNVDNDDNGKEGAYIGAAAGAATGALAGYAICALMPEAAPPPPPPPAPAPKPAAKAAPVVQKTVVLPGVNFAFNSADLLPAAKEILDREVIPELKADPELQVLVEGHTDSVGNDAYNEKLSGRRAGSVWKYLVEKGIDSGRIQARGLGETQPIADNDTAEGRAKNRRVEIKELK